MSGYRGLMYSEGGPGAGCVKCIAAVIKTSVTDRGVGGEEEANAKACGKIIIHMKDSHDDALVNSQRSGVQRKSTMYVKQRIQTWKFLYGEKDQ